MRLEGKTAIITGAASGIGAASAALFIREGAQVVIADRDSEALKAVAAACGDSCMPMTADVAVAADVSALVDACIRRFGRLDVMFNNAGVSGRALVHEMTEEMFDRVVAVNLKGTWLGAKYAIIQMLKQDHGGVIINTASVAAMLGVSEQGAYAPTKAGICALTRVIAAENASAGIRCNAICPGPVATQLMRDADNQPLDLDRIHRKIAQSRAVNRMALPEEIATTAVFLASDESMMISGASIVVDGGMSVTQARRSPRK